MWKQVYGTASFKYGKVAIEHRLVLLKFHDKTQRRTLLRLWEMEDHPKLIESFTTLKDANAFTASYLRRKADANESIWKERQAKIATAQR